MCGLGHRAVSRAIHPVRSLPSARPTPCGSQTFGEAVSRLEGVAAAWPFRDRRPAAQRIDIPHDPSRVAPGGLLHRRTIQSLRHRRHRGDRDDSFEGVVRQRDADPVGFLDRFYADRVPPGVTWAGFKFMLGHNIAAFRALAERPDIRIIYVWRENGWRRSPP